MELVHLGSQVVGPLRLPPLDLAHTDSRHFLNAVEAASSARWNISLAVHMPRIAPQTRRRRRNMGGRSCRAYGVPAAKSELDPAHERYGCYTGDITCQDFRGSSRLSMASHDPPRTLLQLSPDTSRLMPTSFRLMHSGLRRNFACFSATSNRLCKFVEATSKV